MQKLEKGAFFADEINSNVSNIHICVRKMKLKEGIRLRYISHKGNNPYLIIFKDNQKAWGILIKRFPNLKKKEKDGILRLILNNQNGGYK